MTREETNQGPIKGLTSGWLCIGGFTSGCSCCLVSVWQSCSHTGSERVGRLMGPLRDRTWSSYLDYICAGPTDVQYPRCSYLEWSHARPGQGGGSRPPRAACRRGTSGSSPASGPSPLLCVPETLADTCGRGFSIIGLVEVITPKSQLYRRPWEPGAEPCSICDPCSGP